MLKRYEMLRQTRWLWFRKHDSSRRQRDPTLFDLPPSYAQMRLAVRESAIATGDMESDEVAEEIARIDEDEMLARKQMEFTRCIRQLLEYIDGYEDGEGFRYAVTFGDAYRDPRVHGEFGRDLGYGSSRSVHKLRLAVDLNLFLIDPDLDTLTYQPATYWHLPFGTYWKTLHEDARWGGDFANADGNHYSFTHWGVS